MTLFPSLFISDYNSVQNRNGNSQSQLHCFVLLNKVQRPQWNHPSVLTHKMQQRLFCVDLIQDLLEQHLQKWLFLQDEVMLAIRVFRLCNWIAHGPCVL